MNCTKCKLSCGKPHNCVNGWGNPDANLIVYLDCPGDTLAEKLFIWITKRLGLTGNDIWVDYIFKCPTRKGDKKKDLEHYKNVCWTAHPRKMEGKSIVIAAKWGDLIIGKNLKGLQGKKDADSGCWILYSFKYLLMNPVECVDAWRILFRAAEEAGLKPKMVVDVPEFRFPSKKMLA